MKIVYVCSPFQGAAMWNNIELAKRISRKAALEGNAVICTHLYYPNFLSEESEREIGIRGALRLLELADEIWVAEGRISPGMAREIKKAGEFGIPIVKVKDPRVEEERSKLK